MKVYCIITMANTDEPDVIDDLIAALLPDVLVKGGDYAPAAVVGRAEATVSTESHSGDLRADGPLPPLPLCAIHQRGDLIHRLRVEAESDHI